jgi:DNA-binding transcriptional regulator of glucitol operon
MTNQFKNKWFYVLVAMIAGLVIGGWGWDKYESTIEARTHGSVFMMVTGALLFVGAVIMLATGSNRK